jgi:branched-chain amino acid transport system permease protein
MGLDTATFVIQILNGLQLAMLLFLLSVGLSVVFGMMNFINLAHGTLYMLGAFIGLSVARWSDSFWAALLLAPIGVAAIGTILHFALLKRLQAAGPMKQVLVTFGLIFVGLDAVRLIWGNLSHSIPMPPGLDGAITVLGEIYPTYRLFIIGLGFAVMVALYFGLERTRIGAVVRAGVDDRTMVAALGINVERAFFLIFCLGCALAGLAGVVAAPVFSVYPGMDIDILILALIVVVVGGPGSLPGAVVGSLIIGMAETFGQIFVPAFSSVMIYVVMAVVLLLKPGGLIPLREMRQ